MLWFVVVGNMYFCTIVSAVSVKISIVVDSSLWTSKEFVFKVA